MAFRRRGLRAVVEKCAGMLRPYYVEKMCRYCNSNDISDCLCRTQGRQQIIWRLAPFMRSQREPSESEKINEFVHTFNRHVVQWRDHHCRQAVLVDGEALLKGRDVGKSRLAGHSVYHFSYPAQFVQVQAILHSIYNLTLVNS